MLCKHPLWQGIGLVLLWTCLGSFSPVVANEIHVESSDDRGVVLRLEITDFKVEEVLIQGQRYQQVDYGGLYLRLRPGEPRIPVTRTLVGVPPDAQIQIEVLEVSTETRTNVVLPPTPTPETTVLPDGQETTDVRPASPAKDSRRSGRVPESLATVNFDGWVRDQRVAQIELHPVQYEPRLRRLQLHPRMRVAVRFVRQNGAPSRGVALPDSADMERAFQGMLINYAQARRWRKPRPRPLPAPAIPTDSVPRLKILVEREGVYRLDYDLLKSAWGAVVDTTDPRNWHFSTGGEDIPVTIRGERDGRFDPGDAVIFYAPRARNRYSRWDVYWLSLGSTRGLRAVEVNGLADSPLAQFVSSFRSRIHFEEDKLHSVLDLVRPEPGRRNQWYEDHDHWFWEGIRNKGEKNQVTIEFPLYDVAETLEKSFFHVLLQGGTPVEHEAIPMINGIRLANARWANQETWEGEMILPAHALIDATQGMNQLTLVRADQNQEEDSTKYPYHMYINAFDIEYTRLLRAVGDTLKFRSPPPKGSYDVRKRRRLEYRITDFLDPRIEVFEIDGKRLTTRIRGVTVEAYELTREDRDRLRRIQALRGETPGEVPRTAYRAVFQQLDTHEAQFVAVSERGFQVPVRVSAVPVSDLKDRRNGADYLVITSPPYLEQGRRLAEWRARPEGGGYRTKAVSTDDIYNEFNHGVLDPKAIKAFLRYAYENWQPPAPTYVVLLGDGTYDFHGVDTERYPEPPEWMGYIPSYYIWTTFGETSVDHWYTTVSGVDALPDFYLGRIPVESVEEARNIVDKLIAYDSTRPNGKWRRRIISVADDDVNNPSDFIFKKSLSEIAQNHSLLGYETVKIFLDDIDEAVAANPEAFGNRLPGQVAREYIIKAFNEGAVLAQYAGHGGPHVWAHEIIFDNHGIERLSENPRLPFLLVLSCYNGYFDAPGEPSMAEAFLRLPRAGAIGMYSATRLTFGTGNDLLNRIVFDLIFRQNVRQLGPIVFASKLTQLIDSGLGELEVMEAYTLFGDPATTLALTDYDIVPEIPQPSVAPGQTLRISAGQVKKAHYNAQKGAKEYVPIEDFEGRLEVTVRYPDGREDQQVLTIRDSRYPEITFTVPEGIPDGQGRVEFYAENATEIAMGGAVFNVRIPRIKQTVETLQGDTLALAVEIADDLRDAGISRVSVDWRDPIQRTWHVTDMVPDAARGPGWYRLPTALPLASTGAPLKYRILIWDSQGNQVASDIQEYRAVEYPDLQIVRSLERNTPLIRYEYIPQWGGWGVRVEVQNKTSVPIQTPVRLAVYEGNPDLDGDVVVDAEAHLIGETVIAPDAWQLADPFAPNHPSGDPTQPVAQQEDPLDTYQVAVAFVARELPPGDYLLFAWVDPGKDQPRGQIRETHDNNNLAEAVVSVQAVRVGEQNAQLQSADGGLSIQLPANAFAQADVITLQPLSAEEVPGVETQPMLTPVKLAGAAAYALLSASDQTKLQQPGLLRLRVDVAALRQQAQAQLGLAEVDLEELPPEQIQAIDFAVGEMVKPMAGYVWSAQLGKWIRLPSTVAQDANGDLVLQTLAVEPTPRNQGSGGIVQISVEPQATPTATWIVFFTSRDTYRLYRRVGDAPLELVGKGSVFQGILDAGPEIPRIEFEPGETPFGFGDVFRFETFTAGTSEPETISSGGILDNRGNGVIQRLGIAPQGPVDEWSLLFVDDDHFQVEGRRTGVLTEGGKPLLGEVGRTFRHPATGLELHLVEGTKPFRVGDHFRFRTIPVALIQSETTLLGPVRVMRSEDVAEPNIRVRVAGQDFTSGDPISPTPNIQAVLSDDNGIDFLTRPLEITVSHNDAPFEPIPASEVFLSHRRGANQVVWNWTPTLEPGFYVLRVQVSDVDGHTNSAEVEFFVNRTLELSALNYPNPFRRDTTITCELTAYADELEVRIYSLAGRLIRVFRERGVVGFVPIYWDGLDKDGDPVANGVYYAKVTARQEGGASRTVKLKMMKLR